MKVRELIALLIECEPDSDILIKHPEIKKFGTMQIFENRNLKLVYIEGGWLNQTSGMDNI